MATTPFKNRVVTITTLKDVRTNSKGTQYLTGSYAIKEKNAPEGQETVFQNFIASGKTLDQMGPVKVGDLFTILGEDEVKTFNKRDGSKGSAADSKIVHGILLAHKKSVAA